MLRTFFVCFKHVHSTWLDGLQVNIFETSEHFSLRRIPDLFLIRPQNEINSALARDVSSLFRADDFGLFNEPDVKLLLNNFHPNEL